MSWNRKDWLKAVGLLGLGATGIGLAGVGPLAALGAGAKGATLAAGLAGPTVPMGAGGLMGAGAMMGKVGGSIAGTAPAMRLAGGMMNPGPQQQPPPRSPMAPQAPAPVGPGYSPVEQAPPGIDPNQWALMSPEQKRALMAQRGMA